MPEQDIRISAKDVSFDDEGRVVLHDSAAADRIKSFVNRMSPEDLENSSLMVGTNGVGCSC
jgi:hypothetical protein